MYGSPEVRWFDTAVWRSRLKDGSLTCYGTLGSLQLAFTRRCCILGWLAWAQRCANFRTSSFAFVGALP